MTNPESYNQFPNKQEYSPDIIELWNLVNNEKIPEGINVDAVMWGEGDEFDRVPKVMELYRRYGGEVPILLSGGLEGNPYRPDQTQNPTGGNIHSREMKKHFLELGVPEQKIILEDISRNAHEQAVNVIRLIKENGWKKIAIVASPWHQMRLFLTFLAELKKEGLDKDIEIINQPVRENPFRKVPGRDKDYEELIPEELGRIDNYIQKGDVASPADGLQYLSQFKHKAY